MRQLSLFSPAQSSFLPPPSLPPSLSLSLSFKALLLLRSFLPCLFFRRRLVLLSVFLPPPSPLCCSLGSSTICGSTILPFLLSIFSAVSAFGAYPTHARCRAGGLVPDSMKSWLVACYWQAKGDIAGGRGDTKLVLVLFFL